MYLLAELFPFVRRVRLPVSRDQVMMLLAAFNLLVLGADTYLAHSISGTLRPGEWVPVIFGPVAAVVLFVGGLLSLRKRMLANLLATVVFLACLVVAGMGTYFHVNRGFLPDAPAGQGFTASLMVWAPPLLGPLTFALIAILGLSAAWQEEPTGSGVLVLPGGGKLRMPYPKTQAYFFLTTLFILVTVLSSVLDHARSNFANPWLWIPTFGGVFATVVAGVLGTMDKPGKKDLLTYFCAMLLLMAIALIGAWLHVNHNMTGQGQLLGERFIRGAPVLAPLLFANMGLLGLIVLLDPREGKQKQ